MLGFCKNKKKNFTSTEKIVIMSFNWQQNKLFKLSSVFIWCKGLNEVFTLNTRHAIRSDMCLQYSDAVKVREGMEDWGVRRWREQQIMTSASICWALRGGDTFNLPPVGRHSNLPLPIVLVTSAFGWLKDECSTGHTGTEQTSRRPLDTHTNTAAQMATDTLLWWLQSRHSPLPLTSE